MFNTNYAQLSKNPYKTAEEEITNENFNWYNGPERDLHNSMLAEAIQHRGLEVRYIRRNMDDPDFMFGEDVNNTFDTAFRVSVYLESLERAGQAGAFEMFGYTMRDEVDLLFHIDLFKHQADDEEPLEGDLVYIPMLNTLFEIKFIDPEDMFYQFGNLPVRRVQCQKFTYSHEEIDSSVMDEDLNVVDFIQQLTDLDKFNEEESQEKEQLRDEDGFTDFDVNNPFGNGYDEPI